MTNVSPLPRSSHILIVPSHFNTYICYGRVSASLSQSLKYYGDENKFELKKVTLLISLHVLHVVETREQFGIYPFLPPCGSLRPNTAYRV